jgi:hypothetical protein
MHRSSSSYWSLGKSVASVGAARGSHVSNASSFHPANTRRFYSPTEARQKKRQKFDRVSISYTLIAVLSGGINAFVIVTNTLY